MMNKRRYFLSAVIVALAVPILIGGLYFKHISRTNQRGEYLTRLENRVDIELLGTHNFNNIKGISDGDFTKGTKLEFLVKYFSGSDDLLHYSINFDSLDLPKKISGKDVLWQLLYFDQISNTYRPIKNGNLENSYKGLEIHRMSILLKDIHKYVLYLYSTKGDVNTYGNLTVKKV